MLCGREILGSTSADDSLEDKNIAIEVLYFFRTFPHGVFNMHPTFTSYML